MRTLLAELLWDARYTVRQLRRVPGFALTVLLTLALAIGATAAMTGVLRATLLNPLPYPHAGTLVEASDVNLRGFQTFGLMTAARADALAQTEHNGHHVFTDLGFYYPNDGQLALAGREPVRASAAAVSGHFFSTIGMAPLLGREINASDDVLHAPLVAVLSHRLWLSVFSGDAHVLGRTVRLGSQQANIVGVMPASFDLPSGVDLWYPGQISAASFGSYRGDGVRFVLVVARLHPEETVSSAQQQAALVAHRLAAAFPKSDGTWGIEVTSLRDSLFGEYRRALLLLTAAIVLLLVVAGVNIAGLQLSRNAVRRA